MVDYIHVHKARFGVEPICAVLSEHGVTIAPSTYYAHAGGPTAAELEDADAANIVFDLWEKNRRLYGQRKLWHTSRRAGHSLGRDQVRMTMNCPGIDRGSDSPRG